MSSHVLEKATRFTLTPEEEKIIKTFVQNISIKFDPNEQKYEKSVFGDAERETAMASVSISNENWRWFFKRALFEAVTITKHIDSHGTYVFTKILPDRSTVNFNYENFKSTLYNICRFYFAKTFDHRYDSLTSLSKSWVDLDKYVVYREKLINLKKIEDEFPEIKGTFTC